ncbi:MAG: peptidylprolyl isomerase [Candidatus Pacebacteria bacterium CG10_big_fil_rev_8_21_14_0_10_42_12]|nr:MAG: peptidylprolyl isomerase [Candidatus Pacebacteria bacterium CG10_big_fil_rev_8_21_14_0_10_42_12]
MKTLEDFGQIEGRIVTLVTTKGNITFELYREQAPLTTANFLSLATTGFYDGVVFHRVIPDFMAQVGDPLSKDPTKKDSWGQGGPGYTIADEFVPELKHDGPGIVSMAKTAAPNTGGSQFFITYEATPWLDGQHSVFGKVTEGLDVLNQISVGDSITSVSIQ